jgi:GNAT superfamily N-acetyltransferase
MLREWVAGRSLARGLPSPVEDRGSLRVDTRGPAEHCRWIFAAPAAEIAVLARSIEESGRLIKVCGSAEELRALVPALWQVESTGWFMARPATQAAEPRLPAGYSAQVERAGDARHVEIRVEDGALAASGHGGQTARAFVYDRIATDAAHRRKGLGTALMAILAGERTVADSDDLLVATDAGRALYEKLGWEVLSPYATAWIEGAA